MKRTLTAIATALALMSAAHARIGETLDESIARYGAIIAQTTAPDGGQFYTFAKGQYSIIIELDEHGRTSVIVYRKSDNSDMSDDEKQNFRDAESGGEKWTQSTWRIWQTSRIAAFYELDPQGHDMFIIMTMERAVAETEKAKAAQKDAQKGF